jgi:hypothetical protein
MKGTQSKDLTLDDEDDENSFKKIKDTTNIMKIAVGIGFAIEIIASAISGHISFLGTINQVAERYLTKPEATFGVIKRIAESPFGQTMGTALEILGSRPVKRALKFSFALASFVILSAATGGALPAIAFGTGVAAIAISSIRDFRASSKMKKRIDLLKKTSSLRESYLKTQNILKSLHLEQKGIDELKSLLIPENSLSPEKIKKPGLYEKFVNAAMPEKLAKAMLTNHAIELKNTFLWSTFDCAGSIMMGDFFEVASTVVIGTISEAKERTEHRELKQQTKATIKSDMSEIGLMGKKFTTEKDLEIALERQEYLCKKLTKAREEGEEINLDSIKKIIESFNQEKQNEKMPKYTQTQKFMLKISKFKEVFFEYLKSWKPTLHVESAKKIAKTLRAERREFRERIAVYDSLNLSSLITNQKAASMKNKVDSHKTISSELPQVKTRPRSHSI